MKTVLTDSLDITRYTKRVVIPKIIESLRNGDDLKDIKLMFNDAPVDILLSEHCLSVHIKRAIGIKGDDYKHIILSFHSVFDKDKILSNINLFEFNLDIQQKLLEEDIISIEEKAMRYFQLKNELAKLKQNISEEAIELLNIS